MLRRGSTRMRLVFCIRVYDISLLFLLMHTLMRVVLRNARKHDFEVVFVHLQAQAAIDALKLLSSGFGDHNDVFNNYEEEPSADESLPPDLAATPSVPVKEVPALTHCTPHRMVIVGSQSDSGSTTPDSVSVSPKGNEEVKQGGTKAGEDSLLQRRLLFEIKEGDEGDLDEGNAREAKRAKRAHSTPPPSLELSA